MMNQEPFTFIILSPQVNVSLLRSTCYSIGKLYHDNDYFAVVGKDTPQDDIKALSKHCAVITGKTTITSLMDAGMQKSRTAWNLIVMSGSIIRRGVISKYHYFAKSQKDILFPVIDRKIYFDEGSINGIFMHKEAYEEIGEFGDDEIDIKRAKLYWAGEAIGKGHQFKAIVGAKLF